jgi:hypothetical protein
MADGSIDSLDSIWTLSDRLQNICTGSEITGPEHTGQHRRQTGQRDGATLKSLRYY